MLIQLLVSSPSLGNPSKVRHMFGAKPEKCGNTDPGGGVMEQAADRGNDDVVVVTCITSIWE